jgi:exodeoxyribonuclease V alpha subunit
VTTWSPTGELDPFDVRIAVRSTGALEEFSRAGVLAAADVHVALRLGALLGEADAVVLLAAALAVRAPRLGHVCTDLANVQVTAAADVDAPGDVQELPWPEADAWRERVAASPLVSAVHGGGAADDLTGAVDEGAARPLRLAGSLLYLERYWREERQVATDLLARAAAATLPILEDAARESLDRLFAGLHDVALQRRATETVARRRLTVVAGGPGTGKTTMIARVLALLEEQAAAAELPSPRVALAAPTGKAAARLEEAVHGEARRLTTAPSIRDRLLRLEATTLHRLLGWRPGSRGRFRHHRSNRLPHDVVIVDETSMMSLPLTASLVEAVRPGARLVLVGDPQKLASVEAVAVLGDVVGPDLRDGPLASSVVVLERVYRFGETIAALAESIRTGATEEALALLRGGHEEVRWIPLDVAGPDVQRHVAPVRTAVAAAAREVVSAASAGDGRGALTALSAVRLLCAHRRGPYGVASWARHVERWLAADLPGYAGTGAWYVGRPLLVTANDYGLRLFNGDTGVVVDTGAGRLAAIFERRGELLEVSPTRLSAVDTVHAMTVHKSQGSQLDEAVVLLPDPSSPVLTRELLYTAVTRAQRTVTVIGTEEALRVAISRPIARASGLRAALWS